MSEKQKVWIRTSVLDIIIHGKNKTCTSRSIPTAGSYSDDHNNNNHHRAYDDNATQYTTYSINSALSHFHEGGGMGGGGEQCMNWGWSRGYIVNATDTNTTATNTNTATNTATNTNTTSAELPSSKQNPLPGGGGGDNKLEQHQQEEMIQVYITDQDSTHYNTTITIPFHLTFKNGDLLMDNTYGDHHQGDQQYYYDDSDDEDGDDYDGGGAAAAGGYDYDAHDNNKNSNRRKGQPKDKYPSDLITLTHLHEPSVIYCLRKRYNYDQIYTSTGPILIALNPFKNCSHVYNEKVMKQYWIRGEVMMKKGLLGGASASASASGGSGKNGGNKKLEEEEEEEKKDHDDSIMELPPHVYATADQSFRNMMSKLEEAQQNSSGNGSSGNGGRGRRPIPQSSSPATSTSNKSSSACVNQSILVSGESGAGKTVTTKFIMQYLATLSKRSSSCSSTDSNNSDGGRRKSLTTSGTKTDIEQQVLQSNPILESFGNARTIRNDNSSRFGKFIEIQFTSTGNLIGANIETYLLEKVRLVSQTEGERNYHIFYEILQGMEDEHLDQYYLSEYTAVDFRMTNQSNTFDRRDGVSDYDTYQDLLNAMETMGFKESEQNDIMSVTSALLHASNLTLNSVNDGNDDESEIDKSNVHLEPLTSLLGISPDALNRALCYFSITAGREKHIRSNSKEKAAKGLLALIKATYGALFTHIVQRVNESITVEDTSTTRSSNTSVKGARGCSISASSCRDTTLLKNKAAASIGVLDIFGFESFKSNSFEQLCINYCNETLQQQFNMFVLKNEQDEYEREGIQWSFISFPDNQDALDLIDKRGSGILSILDDQCRAPGTTDKTFINDVYQKLSRHKRFQANRRQVGSRKFAIVHYAGTVEYGSKGFVEKNRDDLPKETTELLLSSSNKFVQTLGHIINGPNAAANPSKSRIPSKSSKLTVGGQFSRQLQELRQKIDNTLPHYIRCLKPNDELVPDHFDPLIVADQLRCAGVIEAVRVSRVGYPQRYMHSRFLARYHILGQSALKKAARSSRRRKPVDVLVEAIALQLKEVDGEEMDNKDGGCGCTVDLVSVGIQVGKTKVFLRRKAYESLEILRNRQMRDSAIKIQALGRCYILKKEYNQSRHAIVTLQCFFRRLNARRIVQEKRKRFNTTKIQTAYRRFLARRRYQAMKQVSLWVQKIYRGSVDRALYHKLNRERRAIIIQNYWRMFYSSKLYKMKKLATITVQCAWRCVGAKRELRALRVAARDLSNTAQERDKLREENLKLQKALVDALSKSSKMDSFEKEREELLAKIVDLESSAEGKDYELKTLQQTNYRLQIDFDMSEKKCDEVNSRLEKVQSEVRVQIKDVSKQHKLEIEQCNSEINHLKEILSEKSTEIEGLKEELSEAQSIITKRDESHQTQLANIEIALEKSDNEKRQRQERIKDLERLCETKEKEKNDLLQKIDENISSLSQPEVPPNVDNEYALQDALDRATQAETKLFTMRQELSSEIKSLEASCREKDEERESQKIIIEKLLGDLKLESNEKMNRFRKLESSKSIEEMHMLVSGGGDQVDDTRLSTPILSLAEELNDNNKKEEDIMALESEINDLKSKLSKAESRTSDQGNSLSSTKNKSNLYLQKEVDKLKKKLAEAKESSAEEILTLQDEVERLNKELRSVKPQNDDTALSTLNLLKIPSNLNNELALKEDINHDGEMTKREKLLYEYKLNKMVDALMVKDEEIRHLRQEITTLRDQLDDGTMSVLSDSRFHDEMDDRSVISRIFTGRPSVQKSSSVRSGLSGYKMSMRKQNMELKREVEELKEELEECKLELDEERERSGKEIKAFAEALKGVDELRQSAEEMSREIIRLRQRDDDHVPEDPFEEVPRDSQDGEGTVIRAPSKSHASNIWSKMRLSVRSLNEEAIPEKSTYKGSRSIHRKNSSDGSVFSSFF